MNLCKKNLCSGCTACAASCPSSAISMVFDDKGFIVPQINYDKCTTCGLCERTVYCLQHLSEKCKNNLVHTEWFAIKLKNDTQRMISQSGGLFYALAQEIINKGGIVYGCAYDDDNTVKHVRVENHNELLRLCGSKYVESNIGTTFRKIEMDLKNDKYVLFSGTPCQVAGIQAFLKTKKIESDKFYSCDFICHGVPSQGVYLKFINFYEKKYRSKIIEINLRDKNISGWRNPKASFRFDDNKKLIDNVYVDLYYSNLALRTSCEQCKYTTINRVSDITMADCWGIEKIYPDLWNDDKGISLAIIQSFKGKKLFEEAQHILDVVRLEEKALVQPQMFKSSEVPRQKDRFWVDYKRIKFDKLMKKYTIYGGNLFRLKRKILKKLRLW